MKKFLLYYFVIIALIVGVTSIKMEYHKNDLNLIKSDNSMTISSETYSFSPSELPLSSPFENQIRNLETTNFRLVKPGSPFNLFRISNSVQSSRVQISTCQSLYAESYSRLQLKDYYLFYIRKLII